MAKGPGSGICTYCLTYSEKRTWDHVLPLSWYPDTTPRDIEKWKVPACKECNQRFGRIEEKLLVRLGLCLDPRIISSLGISHKALRAVSPQFAKNERDRKARQRDREKLLKETIYFERLPAEGILPHFGPQPGLVYHGYHAVLLDPEKLRSYTEKLVRGMSVVLDGRLLDVKYEIEPYEAVKQDGTVEIDRRFGGRFRTYHRGFGFVVRRLVAKGDKGWLYEFTIWQRLRLYAFVCLRDLAEIREQSNAG